MKLLSVTFQEDFLQPAEQVGSSEEQHLTCVTVLKFSSGVEKICSDTSLLSFGVKECCPVVKTATMSYKQTPAMALASYSSTVQLYTVQLEMIRMGVSQEGSPNIQALKIR